MSALSRALTELRLGRIVVLMDDVDRENEGDLVVAAEFATPETINFMATHGRGLFCLAVTGDQVDRLGLQPMVASNQSRRTTAFTVSIEAAKGSLQAFRHSTGRAPSRLPSIRTRVPANDAHNKGREAAAACIEALATLQTLAELGR